MLQMTRNFLNGCLSVPDAADMEEAMGKFMEGMEKQELNGYTALHKLLEGPSQQMHVQKNAGSMMQAEALQGGFLRDLDEDEKKRFTPSEPLLYKVAVEYRYTTVHTCTYLVSQADCPEERCCARGTGQLEAFSTLPSTLRPSFKPSTLNSCCIPQHSPPLSFTFLPVKGHNMNRHSLQ